MPCDPSSGFSLLEVLVASGILVFGILAIARIFPAGLGVIRSNNDVNTATRLAEDLQTRYSRLKDELPDAVISVDTSGGFVTNIDPTTSPDDPAPNSVSGVTRVVGEAHEVFSNGSGNFVFVNFPAIASPTVTSTSADPELQNPRVYRQKTLSEVSSAPGTDQFQQTAAGTLNIYGSGVAGRYVRISYKWIDSDSTTNGRTYYVEGERHPLPASGGSITVAAADPANPPPGISPANFSTVLAKSWKVVEEKPVAVASISDEQRLSGVVPLTGVTSPDIVKVDYTVEDWRYITEELTVPQSEVLPLLFIDVLANKVHAAISTKKPANAATVVFPNATNSDYQKGKLSFPTMKGESLRVTYQTGAEWTVQIAKVPASFTNAVTSTKPETYRQFADRFWQGGSDTQTLGFKQINAGGTVVVDYATTTGTSVYGELHAIGKDAASTPVYADYPYEIKLFYPYREIISVRGVSSTARVFWIDKGHYRRVEIPTYLVKK